MPFVGLALMRLLRPNMPVLCHVDGNLQRANYLLCCINGYKGVLTKFKVKSRSIISELFK